MNPLVASNVRKTLRSRWGAAQAPDFFLTGTTICCTQADLFGFYALVRAIRGLLVGTRFQQAADNLASGEYTAASVVCYYTAGLNMSLAFLATEGRVFIDDPRGPRRQDAAPGTRAFDRLWPDDRSVMAVLGRNNTWSFEARGRNHAARWRELVRVYSESRCLPEPFLDLFEYALSYGPHRFVDVCEADDYEEALIKEGAKAVPRIRHEAVYRGYGYDDYAVDLIANGEGGSGLDLKAGALRSFATSVAPDLLRGVSDLLQTIDHQARMMWRTSLILALFGQEFEIGEPSVAHDPEYSAQLQRLFSLIFPEEVGLSPSA